MLDFEIEKLEQKINSKDLINGKLLLGQIKEFYAYLFSHSANKRNFVKKKINFFSFVAEKQ